MKNFILPLAVSVVTAFSLPGCAGKAPKPKFVDEKNEAKFAKARSFETSPEKTRIAALAVLDQLTRASEPQASEPVKEEDNSLFTGWVYGVAKDKYVQYDFNGTPRRKPLSVRRIYGYKVEPSLSGSQVTMTVEEEIQEVDLKTGAPKDWKRMEADPAAYDLLLRRLREQIRAQ
jgi:hypothetical protein